MRKKAIKIISVATALLVLAAGAFAGCKKKVTPPTVEEGLMLDKDIAPTQTAYYEEYTAEAMNTYRAVANAHIVDGEVDTENEDVLDAARDTAAKLYAYACFNERGLERYVYFSDQTGTTDLGTSGNGIARKQDYYLRVNENDTEKGFRYFYTIKKVEEATGVVATFKSQFESAKIRISENTSTLYRFEGSKIEDGEEDKSLGTTLLTCDWKTSTKDWGVPDTEMVKGAFVEPEDLKSTIELSAGTDDIDIKGNINILAENIVKYANISEDEDGTINVLMTIDTEIANSDEASLKMLRRANSSDNCVWVADEEEDAEGFGEDTGLRIIFRLWNNGLFRSYTIAERWSGKIVVFDGEADSQTTVYYSYSDRDCDIAQYKTMLEDAKALVNNNGATTN
jgi:hypothetical protein